MYKILFYFFTLSHGSIAHSKACENYSGAEACILCEKCAEKNNKIYNDTPFCTSMKPYLNDCLDKIVIITLDCWLRFN